ncbi:MAG TPA: acetyl-CoA C-acetyltransferase [Hyphomicrobiaceae bacterium]|nr:acetyl-CoA C-acetyltransferase [Hyphomicrobiaceae bacterium]
MDQTLRRVAVIGGVRIPFCRSNTLYADQSNLDMLTGTLNGLVDKYHLEGVHIDEAVGGAVVTHSKDWNLAREAVLGTKLARTTPGITIQQACGTSLQAAAMIAGKIATGEIENGIAMGSDTTSDAPIVFKQKFAHRLVEVQNARSMGERLSAFKGFSPGELAPQPPNVSEPRTGLSMGQHAELMAQEWKISRADQDQLAYDSHRKAAEAYRSGYMDDLVVPFAGVFRDNNLREDISLEKIATLKTAFDKSERGTLTAANSTPLTDGAAAVLLASEEWAAKRALPVQAYLTYSQTSANNFVEGEGLLMAPTIAVSRMLERAGLKLQDFDFYEIHEAFAAQVLATLEAFEDPAYCKKYLGRDMAMGAIDRAKLNVKGSSLAFGHPFAATGARILANLAKLLAEHGGRGLISVCTAGGMGVAAILESRKAAEMRMAA